VVKIVLHRQFRNIFVRLIVYRAPYLMQSDQPPESGKSHVKIFLNSSLNRSPGDLVSLGKVVKSQIPLASVCIRAIPKSLLNRKRYVPAVGIAATLPTL